MKQKTKSFRILRLPLPKIHQLYGILPSILFLYQKAAATEYISYKLSYCWTVWTPRLRKLKACQGYILTSNVRDHFCLRVISTGKWTNAADLIYIYIYRIYKTIFLSTFHLTLFVFKASLSPLPPSFSLILHLVTLFLTLNCMSMNNNTKNVCFSEILKI